MNIIKRCRGKMLYGQFLMQEQMMQFVRCSCFFTFPVAEISTRHLDEFVTKRTEARANAVLFENALANRKTASKSSRRKFDSALADIKLAHSERSEMRQEQTQCFSIMLLSTEKTASKSKRRKFDNALADIKLAHSGRSELRQEQTRYFSRMLLSTEKQRARASA